VDQAERDRRRMTFDAAAGLYHEARRHLAGFPAVEVAVADFETWPGAGPFDLVFAATAWHWVDPATGLRRARALLRPGGHLAIWDQAHVVPAGGAFTAGTRRGGGRRPPPRLRPPCHRPIDDSVRAAPCAEAAVQRRQEALAMARLLTARSLIC
jgi:SAM-dependent methyltransferase